MAAKSRSVRLLHAAAVGAGASDLVEHLDADRLLTREEAMCSLGVTNTILLQLRRRDLLLALPISTGNMFPAFQIDPAGTVDPQICRANQLLSQDVSPWDAFRWWVSVQGRELLDARAAASDRQWVDARSLVARRSWHPPRRLSK